MMRCIIVSIMCWIALAAGLSWDSLMALYVGDTFPYFSLDVYLSFAYTLFLVVPVTTVAVVLGSRHSKPWWVRGLICSAVACGIVVIFLLTTAQLEAVVCLAPATAGFVIGISARRASNATGPHGQRESS